MGWGPSAFFRSRGWSTSPRWAALARSSWVQSRGLALRVIGPGCDHCVVYHPALDFVDIDVSVDWRRDTTLTVVHRRISLAEPTHAATNPALPHDLSKAAAVALVWLTSPTAVTPG